MHTKSKVQVVIPQSPFISTFLSILQIRSYESGKCISMWTHETICSAITCGFFLTSIIAKEQKQDCTHVDHYH